MAEYLAPGVYVEEVERGAAPLAGASTSTAGFLGPTERGPTDPRLLTSFSDFRQLYGGYLEESFLPAAVDAFFTNGGNRCFLGRVTGATESATAALTDDGTESGKAVLSVDATGPGAWGEHIALIVSEASLHESNEQLFKLTVRYWADAEDRVAAKAGSAYPDNEDVDVPVPDVEEVYDDLSMEKQASNYVEKQVNGTSALIEIDVQVEEVRPANLVDADGVPTDPVWLGGITEEGEDDDDEANGDEDGNGVDENGNGNGDGDGNGNGDGADGNGNGNGNGDGDGNGNGDGADGNGNGNGTGPENENGNPNDETPDPEDYRGDPNADPADRTGFAGFEQISEISILCVPDEVNNEDDTDALRQHLIGHCEAMDDRFAILQAQQSGFQVSDLRPPEDTDMAAFYYPWVKARNPDTGLVEEIPPGGHIAGIYARSDARHGVHKAPANEIVRGISDLQRPVPEGDQEILNPRGVNCIRKFRGRGIRVWGARTASSNPNWKYVNVRRLFLYIRDSIDQGTQWVVFEPNNEELWARVEQTIKNFLTDLWENGALMGNTPDEAFFVTCDRSTMTQRDIENGRLICEIGVAPTRPAEFVIFRISQWTAEGS